MTFEPAEFAGGALPYLALGGFTILYLFRGRLALLKGMDYPFFLFWAMLPWWSRNQFDLLNKLPVAAGLGILLMTKSLRQEMPIRSNRYELLFLLAVLLSAVNGLGYPGYTVGLMNFAYIMLVSFYVGNHLRLRGGFELVLASFRVNAVILSLLAIAEFAAHPKPRPTVTFANPNYLGFYLMIGAIAIIPRARSARWLPALAITLGGVGVTQSVACVLGLAVALSLYLAEWFPAAAPARKWGLRLLAPLLIAMTLVTIYQDQLSRLLMSLTGVDARKEDSVRYSVWKVAGEAFASHPIVGVGYNAFPDVFEEHATPEILLSAAREFFSYEKKGAGVWVTHNDFVRIMAELGALGLAVFLAYLAAVVGSVERVPDLPARTLLGALVGATLVFSFSHNNINSPIFWLLLSFPVAWLAAGRRQASGDPGPLAAPAV